MPEDQSAFLAERFVAAEGTALPGAVRPIRPPLRVAPVTPPPSPEVAALLRETHALRWALLLARTFGVTSRLPKTPSVAMQAAALAAWIDAGCHGVPTTTDFAEQQLRHFPAELRP